MSNNFIPSSLRLQNKFLAKCGAKSHSTAVEVWMLSDLWQKQNQPHHGDSNKGCDSDFLNNCLKSEFSNDLNKIKEVYCEVGKDLI